MLEGNYSSIGFSLNIIRLFIHLFTLIVSLMISGILIYRLYYTRMKRDDKIIIIHCINIYILIFILMITQTPTYIQMLIGDLNGQNFDSSWCRFMAFLPFALSCVLYYVFVDQAFYRLCRIVYSKHRYLQLFWLHIVLPVIQLILVCILFCPLFIWNNSTYQVKEYYCVIDFSKIRTAFFITFHSYIIPIILLSFIYIRILIFIRKQPKLQISSVKYHQQQRDLLVIRRIVINFSLLLMTGVPGIVLMILKNTTKTEHPLCIRIASIFIGLFLAMLSVSFVVSIPQLKNLVLQRNRIVVITTIQMKNRRSKD